MLVEKELGATFAPQNFYCYVVDVKSSSIFHRRMQALASCFPNVFLMSKQFLLDSHGLNMGYAHRECMLALAKKEFKWKYLMLLQVSDIHFDYFCVLEPRTRFKNEPRNDTNFQMVQWNKRH